MEYIRAKFDNDIFSNFVYKYVLTKMLESCNLYFIIINYGCFILHRYRMEFVRSFKRAGCVLLGWRALCPCFFSLFSPLGVVFALAVAF